MRLKTIFYERIKLSVLVFIVLFILTVPFPLQSVWNPVYFYEKHIINFEHFFVKFFVYDYPFQKHLHSDSPDLLVHLYFLTLVSIIISFAFFKNLKQQKIGQLLFIVSTYILAFFLIKYGFDKLFKMQFYYPEPNILHTDFGKLDKDILFWSTMGKSYSYNVFMGLIEIIPGILLFFRKTRKLASLIAFAVLLNVLVINFSFEIEVKILSSFLLLLSIIIILNYRVELISFFFKNETIFSQNKVKFNFNYKSYVKYSVIFFIFFESTFLAFSTFNFNDDNQQRPEFHGAYKLFASSKIKHNLLGLPSIFRQNTTINKLFFHRKNYLIIKDFEGKFYSYKLIPITDNTFFLKQKNINLKIKKMKFNKFIFKIQKDSIIETYFSVKIQD